MLNISKFRKQILCKQKVQKRNRSDVATYCSKAYVKIPFKHETNTIHTYIYTKNVATFILHINIHTHTIQRHNKKRLLHNALTLITNSKTKTKTHTKKYKNKKNL